MTPQIIISFIRQDLFFHPDFYRNRLRCSALTTQGHTSFISARLGVFGDLYSAPQRLHLSFRHIYSKCNRLSIPVNAFLVKAGYLLLRNDIRTVGQIRKVKVHLLHGLMSGPDTNLPRIIFIPQRHTLEAGRRSVLYPTDRQLIGQTDRERPVFGEKHRIHRIDLFQTVHLACCSRQAHRRKGIKARTAFKAQHLCLRNSCRQAGFPSLIRLINRRQIIIPRLAITGVIPSFPIFIWQVIHIIDSITRNRLKRHSGRLS